MTLLEVRDSCCAEERKAVHLAKNVGNIRIVSIDGSDPIHFTCPREANPYFPSMTLSPSQAAPTSPATITLMTALRL